MHLYDKSGAGAGDGKSNVRVIPFLKQVAAHYLAVGDISERTFVFPNRRASVFFRKYLAELTRGTGRPLLVPELVTVNDLFLSGSKLRPADRIRLLVELYSCYSSLYSSAESLDEFIFWGDVLLNDFSDIDKYLVDPASIFTNIADLKDIQDDYSYLSDLQREAIRSFVAHFRIDRNPEVGPVTGDKNIKEDFLRIWNILLPLYNSFNARLEKMGIAYEGMIYRRAAENGVGQDKRYVFVGLNALNECERKVLKSLQRSGLAEFCWDFSSDMIRDGRNRSSLFMARNVEEFPQAFVPDEGVRLSPPTVNLLAVPSAVGQAKRLSYILKSLAPGGDIENLDCESTAVVLPDETLLVPVLNSIPPEIGDINVTMGYPLKDSDIFVFMRSIASLQLNVVSRGEESWFYHRFVRAVFTSSIFRRLCENDSAEDGDIPASDAVKNIVKAAKSYIPATDFASAGLLRAIFRRVFDPSDEPAAATEMLADYMLEILELVGRASANSEMPDMETVFVKEYYTHLVRLKDMHLSVKPSTFVRIIGRIVAPVAVPFAGEPLKGLQVMGPLETRCLDFRNVIILSANEGVFPHRSVSSSFIPPELRKGFGLPTYEYQDAVWAYYFYRLIQRTDNLWMVYDSRTEGLTSGEESRYLKQLQYHFKLKINRFIPAAEVMTEQAPERISKTESDIAKIRSMKLSASALQSYLSCPARFYYTYVCGLKEEQEAQDSLDRGMLGTVFHALMQWVYSAGGDGTTPCGKVTADRISYFIGEDGQRRLSEKTKELICGQLHSIELKGRDIVTRDVIVEYAVKALSHDIKLLKDRGKDSFEVLGLELNLETVFHGFRFKGIIDRLDSFSADSVRIVDYKTGKVTENDYDITDDNAETVAAQIFTRDASELPKDGRPKIAFQFYIYNMLLAESADPIAGQVAGRLMENSVYSVERLFSDGPAGYRFNRLFYDSVTTRLKDCLDEMVNPDCGFDRTENEEDCNWCQFKMICGRTGDTDR